MSDCCGDHENTKKSVKESKSFNEKPKSFLSKTSKGEGFIGRYLYKLGKEDAKKADGEKGDCC